MRATGLDSKGMQRAVLSLLWLELACSPGTRGKVLERIDLPAIVDSGAPEIEQQVAMDSGLPSPTLPGTPIAVWHFDEGQGVTTTSGPLGIATTLVDAPEWTDGTLSSALRFGVTATSHLEAESRDELRLRGNMTLAIWYRLWGDTLAECAVLAICGGPSEAGSVTNALYGLSIRDGALFWYHEYGVQMGENLFSEPLTGMAVTAGGWHHAVAVRDADAMRVDFYSDGQSVSSANFGNNAQDGSSSWLHIGMDSDPSPENVCNGSIQADLDELVLYDVALGAEQVTELYDYYGLVQAMP